jgi:glycosyltransferase involved in cell wall biosynthesis
MRVIVATGALPLARGGAEILASELCSALRRAGHTADKCVLFHRPFGRFAAAYLSARFANVTVAQDGAAVERLISLRFPAYAAPHPHHVCWMLHRARPYYDLWSEFFRSLPTARARLKERLRRRMIHLWDRRCLRRVRTIFALSREVQARLAASGFASEVLYPPPRHGLEYGPSAPGEYILSPARLDDQKRIELLLEALAAVPGVRAVLTGEGPRRPQIEALARRLGVWSRVEFRGLVPDAELSELYRGARAVWFCPRREEFGYVALEAMSFGKPLVTARDSGGPTELVEDGRCALVIEPQPARAAEALRQLAESAELAERLGREAYARRPRGNWEEALARLLGQV